MNRKDLIGWSLDTYFECCIGKVWSLKDRVILVLIDYTEDLLITRNIVGLEEIDGVIYKQAGLYNLFKIVNN